MAITKAVTSLFAAVSCGGATPGTKAAPSIWTAWQDMTGSYGGDVGLRIVNGTAPGIAPTLVIQFSPDNGTTVYDYATVGGDVTASSDNSSTIWIDQGLGYIRVIGYGNTTNAVTVTASLSKITAV